MYFQHISSSKIVLKSPSSKNIFFCLLHHAGYMSTEICLLKKTRIKKDSGRNYTSFMGFNLFTASSHHSGLKQCIMQHKVVDFRLVDRLFFIAKQNWKDREIFNFKKAIQIFIHDKMAAKI